MRMLPPPPPSACLLLALAACAGGPAARPGPDGGMVVETSRLAFAIGADARPVRFADPRTGQDHLAKGAPPCARIRKAGRDVPASAAALHDGVLTFRFGDSGVEADVLVRPKPSYVAWEVAAVRGGDIESLTFLDLPLALKGIAGEPFAAAALALNDITNVGPFPGPTSRLTAACVPKFGLAGAAVAIVAGPPSGMRRALQEAVTDAPGLPKSSLGGPWAMDAELPHGSYLFDFGSVNEKTVDDWIRVLKSLGFTQLVIHGGRPFRFGDCRVNPEVFAGGRAGFKAVVDKLHAAGIAVGVDVYAFFIDKQAEWVTPVPDRRLAGDATFTLDADLAADAAEVPVAEPTGGMSAVTGFFVRNSATLRIDDELVVFGGATKEAPYRFTGCARGALGTKAAAHAKGAKAVHLKECFGLFVPDPETPLFGEVAAHVAGLADDVGLDMLYLDALDGEDILGGAANGWHYGSRFVYEIWKRLKRPVLTEMSTFHHHLWAVRSRAGAWDHPRRSHKPFIDLHVAANAHYRDIFMPSSLGWWAVQAWTGAQEEPTYPDDIEYLCAKALGTGDALALMGINPDNARTGGMPRLAEVFRRYETLRLGNAVPERIRERLRAPGEEFRLVDLPGGGWEFRPARADRHAIGTFDGRGNVWSVRNPFGRQAPRLRIEALLGAGPYDAGGNVVLADAASAAEFTSRAAAPGVSAELSTPPASPDVPFAAPEDGKLLSFSAVNGSPSARGAWAKAERTFKTPLNLEALQALGVWVHGDGQGEVLNIQLRSPEHLVAGIGDHYIVVDFTGWRYVELVEPEGARYADYAWPYGNPYAIYRESVVYGQVSSVGLWLNNVPPGKTAAVRLGPVKAVPAAKQTVTNPAVRIGGRTVTLDAKLESGFTLELEGPDDARLYGPAGDLRGPVKGEGGQLELAPGDNEIALTGRLPVGGPSVRARVTVFSEGAPLR